MLRRYNPDPVGEADSRPGPGTAPSHPPCVSVPALLALVDTALRELHAGVPGLPTVTPASVLHSDLGFDSLARAELLLRIERAFGIRMPDDTLQRVETVGDLLHAAEQATPAPERHAGTPPRAPVHHPLPTAAAAGVAAAGAEQTPAQAQTLLEVLE